MKPFLISIFALFLCAFCALSYAQPKCSLVQINIINLQDQPITLIQDGDDLIIPGGTSGYYKIIPKDFYTKQCQSIELITQADPKPQLGLLGENTKIALRVEQDGKIQSNLPYNFSVYKLIPYHGLEPFLS